MYKAYRVRKKMQRSPGDGQLILEVLWYKEEPDPDAEYTAPDLIDQVPTGCRNREHVTPELVDQLVTERFENYYDQDEDEDDLVVLPEVTARHIRHGGIRVQEAQERDVARRGRRRGRRVQQ